MKLKLHLAQFARNDDGYVFVLTLMFLPVLFGMAVLVIDLGRGNNAHSDLYAASDALAIAGARELDGRADAICRARAAMEELSNTVNFLAPSGEDASITLTYEDDSENEFDVIFLEEIPDNDDTPIDQAWVNTWGVSEALSDCPLGANGATAKYVYVRAQSRNLQTVFFNPIGLFVDSVPISAKSVATYKISACKVPPLFICNPFEDDVSDLANFAQSGGFYGRIIKLHPPGNSTAGPGNFGYLQVPGVDNNSNSGKNAVREYFAGQPAPACFDSNTVTTAPGAAVSVAQGINVRFDIYKGPFNGYNPSAPNAITVTPDKNVRKSWAGSNDCRPDPYDWEQEIIDNGGDMTTVEAMGFPDDNGDAVLSGLIAGAYVGDGLGWDIETYWQINHGEAWADHLAPNPLTKPVNPFDGTITPSRRDIYRYEILQHDLGLANSLVEDEANEATPTTDGWSGDAICSAGKSVTTVTHSREIFAAMINCNNEAVPLNGSKTVELLAFAKLFMVNPMQQSGGSDSTIDIEIVDISGPGGNGEVEDLLRAEAYLVR